MVNVIMVEWVGIAEGTAADIESAESESADTSRG